jgi:hypothetical protein
VVFARTGSDPTLWRVSSDGGPIERVQARRELLGPVISRDERKLAYSQFYVDTNIGEWT